MLATKRKVQQKRKRITQTIFLIIGLTVFFFGISLVFFLTSTSSKDRYISPLGTQTVQDTDYQEQEDIAEIKKSLREQELESSAITVVDSYYLIILKDGVEVRVSPEKNIKTQISSLQFILSRLKMEGKRVKTLDIRFDKPVVVFQ